MLAEIEVARPSSNPLDVVRDERLTDEEARYVAASRAANTVRGYATDWRAWCAWAEANGHPVMPADDTGIARWLTSMADSGYKVGTMSRKLSAVRFAHRTHGAPDATQTARVLTVWEGIRRVHSAPPEQSAALYPNELWDVIDNLPSTWSSKRRSHEADLAGLRDRVLLLVGWVGALRRSELSAIQITDLAEHPNGLVLSLPRSKTNQTGDRAELVVLPRARMPQHCPVTAVRQWCEAARITDGPLLRTVSSGNRAGGGTLGAQGINLSVKSAVARIGLDPTRFSAHSLRAGFVTYAHLRGSSDRAIAHQTRHRSLATLGMYIRVSAAWDDNAATGLGL